MEKTKKVLRNSLVLGLGVGLVLPVSSAFAAEGDSPASTQLVSSSEATAVLGIDEVTVDEYVIPETDYDPDGLLTSSSPTYSPPAPDNVSTEAVSSYWENVKKDYIGIQYGSWKTLLERSSGQAGSITITFTKNRSNSYSGELKVSKASMDSYVGFNITKSTSVSVSDTHSGLSKNKSYLAQYRTRNKVYEVTQQRVSVDNWTGKVTRGEKKILTVKKQDGFSTRVDPQ